MKDRDELIPSILEPVEDHDFSGNEPSKKSRKNWARLIQKIYEVDPLTCPKCSGEMKVISVIEDEEIVKKILKHLGLWDRKTRPPPKVTGQPKAQGCSIDYSVSQLPCLPDGIYGEVGCDKRLYVDAEYLTKA